MFRSISLTALVGLTLLGATPAQAAEPDLVFTSVPALNSHNNLSGRVTDADPATHRVAVYLFVDGSGWWNKPSFTEASTVFASDGTWTVDVTTGGSDPNATKLAAFLIPSSYSPPNLSGASNLPPALLEATLAHDAIYRHPLGNTRLVYFSNYEWWVKNSSSPVGPGPNLFSNSHDNVRIDPDGRLHMNITKSSSTYYCPEIVSTASFGYGTYLFRLDSPVDGLDPNTVVGLFTWSDQPQYAHREIDIEFSRWTNPAQDEAQFVLQPWDWSGHIDRFSLGDLHVPSAHGFTWSNGRIDWRSVRGSAYFNPQPGAVIHEWSFTGGDVPVPGDENARINFWLVNGWAPTNGQPAEVIFNGFEHVALGQETDETVSGTVSSSLPPDNVREGNTIELTAPSGASAYRWYRDGQPLVADGQVLTLTNVGVADAGLYTCAYNPSGSSQWLQTEPFTLVVLPVPQMPAADARTLATTLTLLALAATAYLPRRFRTESAGQ